MNDLSRPIADSAEQPPDRATAERSRQAEDQARRLEHIGRGSSTAFDDRRSRTTVPDPEETARTRVAADDRKEALATADRRMDLAEQTRDESIARQERDQRIAQLERSQVRAFDDRQRRIGVPEPEQTPEASGTDVDGESPGQDDDIPRVTSDPESPTINNPQTTDAETGGSDDTGGSDEVQTPSDTSENATTEDGGVVADPPDEDVIHEMDVSDDGQEARDKSLVGKPRPAIEPARYISHPEDSSALEVRVDSVGRDQVPDWIGHINPRLDEGGPPFQNNCGECSRAFAATSQTDTVTSAAGDRALGEGPEMWEWTGIRPTNTMSEPDLSKLDEFQPAAWDRVASDLSDEPVGRVAIVGVDWAPVGLGDSLVPQGGHWFNVHVTDEGLRWVDAQDGTYADWPPEYPDQITTVEYVFRRPDETEWRT